MMNIRFSCLFICVIFHGVLCHTDFNNLLSTLQADLSELERQYDAKAESHKHVLKFEEVDDDEAPGELVVCPESPLWYDARQDPKYGELFTASENFFETEFYHSSSCDTTSINKLYQIGKNLVKENPQNVDSESDLNIQASVLYNEYSRLQRSIELKRSFFEHMALNNKFDTEVTLEYPPGSNEGANLQQKLHEVFGGGGGQCQDDTFTLVKALAREGGSFCKCLYYTRKLSTMCENFDQRVDWSCSRFNHGHPKMVYDEGEVYDERESPLVGSTEERGGGYTCIAKFSNPEFRLKKRRDEDVENAIDQFSQKYNFMFTWLACGGQALRNYESEATLFLEDTKSFSNKVIYRLMNRKSYNIDFDNSPYMGYLDPMAKYTSVHGAWTKEDIDMLRKEVVGDYMGYDCEEEV